MRVEVIESSSINGSHPIITFDKTDFFDKNYFYKMTINDFIKDENS
jgi:hypothetical protein